MMTSSSDQVSASCPFLHRRPTWGRTAAFLSLLVVAAMVLASCSKSPSPSDTKLEGSWQGAVTIEGRNLGIVVHFKSDGSGTIDIPSQQAYALPLQKISFDAPKVSFELQAGSDAATFRGRLSGDTIKGSFEQAGHKGSFSIVRPNAGTSSSSSTAGDIPVVLRTPTGDLHGSLAMPSGKGPFPVVLVISGSGAMDRNGNLPQSHVENNDLLMLAEALKEKGIAALRYDKRGVGASEAALQPNHPLLFSDLINDAASWIDNLKRDERFTKVGVIGYDEGSLVGMVAAENSKADVFVSIAGWAESADVRLRAAMANQPPSIRSDAQAIISKLKAGDRVTNVSNNLRGVLGPQRQPFLISEFQYDPRREIARLTMPVLIIQGTNDLEVDTKQAEELHKARPGSYLDLISGMNHVLKHTSTNEQTNFATYSNPDLPLDPELVQVLTAFLRSVMVPITATTGQSVPSGR